MISNILLVFTASWWLTAAKSLSPQASIRWNTKNQHRPRATLASDPAAPVALRIQPKPLLTAPKAQALQTHTASLPLAPDSPGPAATIFPCHTMLIWASCSNPQLCILSGDSFSLTHTHTHTTTITPSTHPILLKISFHIKKVIINYRNLEIRHLCSHLTSK